MSMNQYMHSRNIYKDKPPDFLQLSQLYPSFAPYVKYSKAGKASVDFRNPDTVRELANCLLNKDFGYTVHLPKNRLSPTIPSRLNYILWVEDLLDTLTTKQSEERKIIDIGTGCACIYPLLGVNINRRFVFTATEMDDTNFKSAKNNVERNHLMDRIKVLKIDPTVKTLLSHVFEGDTERYDCCICNPPFYKNVEDVISRGRAAANSSCRASNVEAITEGGDLEFAERIYRESLIIRDRLSWYTIMFGKKSSFMSFKKKFVGNESILTATYEFCQGNTIRWGFAWSYTPQSINASKIPTSPFQQYSKASRQSKPISFYIEAPTVESSKELLLKIFKDLAISVEIPSTDPAGSSFSAVAIQNTWVGARQRMRKRKYNDICNDMVVLEAKSLPEPVLEFQVTMNEQASGCTLTTFKTEIQSKKEVLNSLVVHIKRLLSKHLQAK